MSAPALTHRSQSHEIEAVERHRTQRAVVGRGSSPQRGIGDEPLARSLAGDVGTRVAGMLAAPVGGTGSSSTPGVRACSARARASRSRSARTWRAGAAVDAGSYRRRNPLIGVSGSANFPLPYPGWAGMR
jgi:hypothetical protein